MGIFIHLNIMPKQITEKDWSSVYQEAKKLINAYPFMDINIDRETYKCRWSYACNPIEKKISYCDNNIGYYLIGDLITMERAEDFNLIKDLNYYKTHAKNLENKIDILQGYDSDFDNAISVFDSKTQGYDYHLYILAIACLIEDRLKPYAMVSGDISRKQMEDAVAWVNGILEKPIELSERADNFKLLSRINNFVQDSLSSLRLFMNATLSNNDTNLGNFIRNNFTAEVIYKHYQKEMSHFKIDTFGFSGIIETYLDLGHDFSTLCDLVLEVYNNKKDINEKDILYFINQIFRMGLHLSPGNLNKKMQVGFNEALSFNPPDSKTPDTIDSAFGKFFVTMKSGGAYQTKSYIPIKELEDVLQIKFSHYIDVNKIIEEHKQKKAELENIEREIPSTENKNLTKNQTYDIDTLHELILWQPSNTIHPDLEKFIFNVKNFSKGDIPVSLIDKIETLKNSTLSIKMKYLIGLNRFFLISKKNWQWIKEGIDNADFFKLIACMLHIDAAEISTNRLILTLLNNEKLFKKYIV